MSAHSGTCDLCGLPLRFGATTSASSGHTYHFCCVGCKQVFSMLLEGPYMNDPTPFRETELFKKCREMGIIPMSEADLEKKAGEKGQHGPEGTTEQACEAVLTLHLRIDQMWCPACAWVVEEGLKRRRGIVNAACNFSTDRLRCDYDPLETAPSQIIDAIGSLGYKASVPGEEQESKEKKRELIRFAVSAFLTMNVMMLSFALYSAFFTELSQDAIGKLSWPIFFMASVVLFYGGRHIYRRAWTGITSSVFSMETLITAGAFSAYLYSTFNLLRGGIHLYYDTAAMLITLVLLGKSLERRAKGEVQEGLEAFFSLRPTKVKICTDLYPDGRYVAAEKLQIGDLFGVEEGEVIPADGLLVTGKGSVDESSLTGEALPRLMKAGNRVKSGTRVLEGRFSVKAEGVGEDSTLGRMISIMEKALGEKTALEGKTDRVLQWFVPVILVLATGTGLACLFYGLTLDKAVIRAVTVMVIACPCTLGIAVPLARVAGISLAGREGLLVRDFSSFERVDNIDAFVFDKTGTITRGEWSLLEIIPFEPFSEQQILSLAASLEETSEHYIAAAIKRYAEEKHIKPAEGVERITPSENGIVGYVGNEEIKIGSKAFLGEEPAAFGAFASEAEETQSSVFMSFGGQPCAIFVFGDSLREGMADTMARLRAAGRRIAVVSGDGDKTTKAIGRMIGVEEAYGGKMPQDKAAFIIDLQKKGHKVAMVGDGINDAPALVQSDLAIAVNSGSHLGGEAADITLMRSNPGQILGFIEIAKRVNKKVTQNLTWSFLYNIISIPIAMAGLLTPLIAVCAMLMSSLSVIGNTLLLVRKHR